MLMCGDAAGSKTLVSGFIEDAGFEAADIGSFATVGPITPPCRAGAIYGEEYHLADNSPSSTPSSRVCRLVHCRGIDFPPCDVNVLPIPRRSSGRVAAV